MANDKIIKERKSLKNIILDAENEVLANAGVDFFEEVFKLIFIKLYDEASMQKDKENLEWQLKRMIAEGKLEEDTALLLKPYLIGVRM